MRILLLCVLMLVDWFRTILLAVVLGGLPLMRPLLVLLLGVLTLAVVVAEPKATLQVLLWPRLGS